MTDIRVTQDAIEVVTRSNPATRVTQDIIEVITQALNPSPRITQYIIELLSAVAPPAPPSGSTPSAISKISAGMVTTFEANTMAVLPCTTVIMYTPDPNAFERANDPDFTKPLPIPFDPNNQAVIGGGWIRNKSTFPAKAVFKKSKKK